MTDAAPTAPTTDQTPATPPAAPQPPAPAAPTAPPAAATAEWDGQVESLPKGAQDLIASLTNGQKEARDAVVQEIVKALGGSAGDQAPTVEQLTEQVTTAQGTARTALVELAVYKAAATHKADPTSLLDSRAFLSKVDTLDPTASDFDAKVAAAIQAAVTENPKLGAVPAPAGASTIDYHAPSTAVTAEQFATMTAAQRQDLYATNPGLYAQLTGR